MKKTDDNPEPTEPFEPSLQVTPSEIKALTGVKVAGMIDPAAAVKKIARRLIPRAMYELERIMVTSKNDMARIAAVREIFDRAYGRTTPMRESLDTGYNGTNIQVNFGQQPQATVIEAKPLFTEAEFDEKPLDEAEDGDSET